MKTYTQEELNEILKQHRLWYRHNENGARADLSGVNLSGVDLRDANLRFANLSGANLSGADLRYTNLEHANLGGADLRYAILRFTNLSSANLRYANLEHANLERANLERANLSGTDLRYAILRFANLSSANLSEVVFNYCTGNSKEIKSLQIGTYLISYHKDILNIGCETHTLKEWENFADDEIAKMGRWALDWWKLNKDIVLTLVRREIK